jgi:predicted nucleic acid-binding protein
VIVVADTSVLINLCQVGQGELFGRLFGEVIVPPEVANEFVRLASSVHKFTGLSLPIGIRQQAATSVPLLLQTAIGLDPGEFAALALAVEIHADAVLVDERIGHEYALKLGLRPLGVLGILLRAKSSALLSEVRPVLDALQKEAGFWVSKSLRDQVLALAGEAN